MGKHSFDIAGYTYRAEQYTPKGLIERLIKFAAVPLPEGEITAESMLDQWAKAGGIDRQDETTFDSNEFPKVIFEDQAEGDFLNHVTDGGRPEYVTL